MLHYPMTRLLLAICALCVTPASAQTASGTVTLTPEEREAAIEAGAARANDISLQYGASDRRVHGEVGVEMDSHGERAAYGTLVAPVGQNGVAAFSYATGQGPRWHGRGRFHGSSVGGELSSGPSPAGAEPAAQADTVNPD